MVNTTKAANLAARGVGRSQRQKDKQGPLDVWTHTYEGLEKNREEFHKDPAASLAKTWDGVKREFAAATDLSQWESSTHGEAVDAFIANAEGVGDAAYKISEADGALQTVGAVFGTLIALEQTLSVPFSVIPFPALPAVRITDQAIGLPHAHMHPPNLIPPSTVPVPLVSAGPLIPIPFISGAATVLINNMPAGRCGDMGIGIWCGGYFPMFEVFLGSSSVWLEGARAARIGVDITKHCIFSTPKPSDPPLGPMVGATVSASANTIIGGVPLPSLTSMAAGKVFGAMFKGLGKLKGLVKAADDVVEEAAEAVAKNADEMADAASRGFDPSKTNIFKRPDLPTVDESFANYQRALQQVEELEAKGALKFTGDDALVEAAKGDAIKIAMSNEGRMIMEDIGTNHARTGKSIEVNAQTTANNPKGPRATRYEGGKGTRNPDGSLGEPGNTRVTYTPGAPGGGAGGAKSPSDAVLAHELNHGVNNQVGGNSRNQPPTKSGYPNREEEMAVASENAYRRERGLPERSHYGPMP